MNNVIELEGASVAIVALGGSHKEYIMSRVNSVKFDEVWGINSIGGIIHVDRTFMMDPPSRFLDDIKAGKQTGIGREFLLETPNKGPIYSCVLDERVPEVVEYPLEFVLNETKLCYFNNTVAYAVAFAVAAKVSSLHLYGIDFTYRGNINMAEAGRACVEFWCAVALSKGIKIDVSPSSTLLDTNTPDEEKLYGYHRLEDPLVQRVEDGNLIIARKSELAETEKKELTPPEPTDPVLIGRHDIKGVTYE